MDTVTVLTAFGVTCYLIGLVMGFLIGRSVYR